MMSGLDASLQRDDDAAAHADESHQRMESALYELGIRGRVGPTLAAALDGFDIVSSNASVTRLRGWVVDQSSLYGLIDTVSSLGLELISVAPVEEA